MKIRKFDILIILIFGAIFLFFIKSCNESNSKIAQLSQQVSQIKPLIDQNRLYRPICPTTGSLRGAGYGQRGKCDRKKGAKGVIH